jgi:hypothetical protein
MRAIFAACCANEAGGLAQATAPIPAMNSRLLVCRERSIVRGDGGRFTTPPPSRLEARSRLSRLHSCSFDHLVGAGEESLRNGETKCPGDFEIDD